MSDVVSRHRSSEDRGSVSSAVDEAQTVSVSSPTSRRQDDGPRGPLSSRYVELEEIGRGAMGRVVRAYDPKLQREVALKEVRGRLSTEGTRRLVVEARAMAKLSHPNVVAIYDVEEASSGEVVLVMEYVPGQTLKQWLGKRPRPWREVVDHFVAAGRGLIAAHEAGILHRDFKPANVLVSDVVKVTDFGLAKEESTASTIGNDPSSTSSSSELTQAGTVMGTPRYMAPEQHLGKVLTAAVDQYAFCIALWVALCGKPPFSGKTMVEDKLLGPPSWPRGSAANATPRPIVDAILRGLSTEPRNRWPSMAALLDALSWDPRQRRTRWMLALGGTAVLGMAGAGYQSWTNARALRCSGAEDQLAGIWDATRAEEVQSAILGVERSYAEEVWTRTQQDLDTYASDWANVHTEACEATTVRGEQSTQMLDLRMACLHRAAVDLQATVETLADADESVVLRAHKLTGRLPPLSRCSDTAALVADVDPPLPAEQDAVEAVRTELARARSLRMAGRYPDSKAAVERAKEALDGVEYGPVHTEAALEEGLILNFLGEYAAAEAALSEALKLGAKWKQRRMMAVAATRLMYVVGTPQRRMDEGLRYAPLAEGLVRGDVELEMMFRNDHASVLNAQGKYAEAEAEHRAALSLAEKALGLEHPDVALSRNNLASTLFEQGKYAEAEFEHRAALAVWENVLGPGHPHVAGSRNNLALDLQGQGKYAEAEREFRTALELREKALGPEHPHVAGSRDNLASILHSQGRDDEAEAELRAAVAILEKTLGPDDPEVARSRSNLAIILEAQGKYAEAEQESRAVLKVLLPLLGPEHPHLLQIRGNLATAIDHQGRFAEAEQEYREIEPLLEKSLGPEHPALATSRHNHALSLSQLERFREALTVAELAWTRRQADDIPPEERADTAMLLANILWRVEPPARDRRRAREVAEDGLRSYQEAGEPRADAARRAQQWLDDHPI